VSPPESPSREDKKEPRSSSPARAKERNDQALRQARTPTAGGVHRPVGTVKEGVIVDKKHDPEVSTYLLTKDKYTAPADVRGEDGHLGDALRRRLLGRGCGQQTASGDGPEEGPLRVHDKGHIVMFRSGTECTTCSAAKESSASMQAGREGSASSTTGRHRDFCAG